MTRLCLPILFYLNHREGHTWHVVTLPFMPALQAAARSLPEALNKLRESVRLWIKAGGDTLLLGPGVPIHEEGISLDIGNPAPEVLTILRFRLAHHVYVVLPGMESEILVLPPDLPRILYVEQIQSGVHRILRERRKKSAPMTVRARGAGERLAEVEVLVNLQKDALSLDGFSAIKQGQAELDADPKFEGEIEIRKVATDLNLLYPDRLKLDWVPDERVREVVRALYEQPYTPLAIVGPSGSGRSTLLQAAIHKMLSRQVASWDIDVDPAVKVWHLDPPRIISGMSIIGHWNRRMESILKYLVTRRQAHGRHRPDALYVDNVVALTTVGRYAGSNLAVSAVLRSWLGQRAFPMVVEATPEEWKKLEERDRPFADLFKVLRVDPPTRSYALQALVAALGRVEATHRVTILPNALRRLVELEERHPSLQVMPGSLITRLERMAARNPKTQIDKETIDQGFSESTGLRKVIFDVAERYTESDARQFLNARLIGQPVALEALTDVVLSMKAGLLRPNKPIATLLMVGPTGVGKTEAVKALAACLFERSDALVRIDMNEFVDAGSAERLVGDGFQEGILSGRLRARPFSVLLLDEIEKAHPLVHDLLLGVLDEGRLTDGTGRRVDLRGSVILMTSNVGASEAASSQGFDRGTASLQAVFKTAVERHFRPEFVNRIDRIVPFATLSKEDVRRIADLLVRKMLSREGFARRTVLLDVSVPLLDRLAAEGYAPMLGARALRRVIEAQLVGPSAAVVAEHPPDQPLWLQVEEGEPLQFTVQSLAWADKMAYHYVEEPEAERVRIQGVLEARRGPDALVAVAGPTGVELRGLQERALLDWLNASSHHEALGDGDAENYREFKKPINNLAKPKGRSFDMNFLGTWRQSVQAHLSLREGLFELAERLPLMDLGKENIDVLRISIGKYLLETLIHPVSFRILARPLVRGGSWEPFQSWISQSRRVIEAMLGSIEEEAAVDTQRCWRVSGLAPYALYKKESGIHLFLPADGPGVGLLVQVEAGGPETPQMRVIRNYLAPSAERPSGMIHDVRTGEMIEPKTINLEETLMRWLLVEDV